MSTIRQVQIQNRLVEEISDMLRREMKDPRIGFVTITGAEISRDLRHAKVFVSVMGEPQAQEDSLAALRRAAGWIRGEFARRAHLRVAPELVFQGDVGITRGARIFELLQEVARTTNDDPRTTKDEGAAVRGGEGAKGRTSDGAKDA